MDISDTLVVKSDQINAEDLIAGPITAKIVGVSRSSDDQPVTIELDGGFKQPNGKWKVWRPCKSMRRLLVLAWPDCVKPAVPPNTKQTIDPTIWVGRSVMLIRDPNVRWGKDIVGGTRVSALSHIKSTIEVALAESKGKKKLVTIAKLETTQASPPTTIDENHQEIAARLLAIKDDWKARRSKRNLTIAIGDWKAFIVHATEGCIAAENSLKAEAFTLDVLEKVEESLNFEMPE